MRYEVDDEFSFILIKLSQIESLVGEVTERGFFTSLSGEIRKKNWKMKET